MGLNYLVAHELWCFVQVLLPVKDYLNEASAKEYVQELQAGGIEDRTTGVMSYADLLRSQREMIVDESKIPEAKYEYKPIKIPKKPDSSTSYQELRERHDGIITKR